MAKTSGGKKTAKKAAKKMAKKATAAKGAAKKQPPKPFINKKGELDLGDGG